MRKVPFNRCEIGEAEVKAAVAALCSGRVAGDGPASQQTARKLCEKLGVRHVFLTPSCTHALELALMGLGVGRGDEILLPSFTFVSAANAALLRGALPVFCEIEPRTLTLDPADVATQITPRTRAVVVDHYAGVAADLAALTEITRAHGIALIEDAAQGVGAFWRGRALGTVGALGVLSFHQTKNLTCGEGGALLTDDEALARRAEVHREKGTDRSAFLRHEVDRYTWRALGSSYLLADVLASVLSAQVDRLEAITKARRAIWGRYVDGLRDLASRERLILPQVSADAKPNGHIFWFRVGTGSERDRVIASLRALGVEATFHYVPLHTSPFAQSLPDWSRRPLPVTEKAAGTLVRLPIYPSLAEDDQAAVIEAVHQVLA